MRFLSHVDRRILAIALPSIVSNITVPLLGLVDVAVTGHMGVDSAHSSLLPDNLPTSCYVGAIAVAGMLFNVIYWMFGFLRMGTSGETAQALGRRDMGAVLLLLVRSLLLVFVLGIMLMLLSPLIFTLSLYLIQPEVEIISLARTYFNICIWGAVPSLALFALNGWYIGMQNSRIPMYVAIGQNIVNIVASILFVYAFHMRIEGVAYGTLLAQWIAFLVALLLCFRCYGKLWHSSHHTLPRFSTIFRQAITPNTSSNRQNLALFLRTLCLIVVHFMFVSAGASQSSVALAVNTLLMQLFTLFSYFMDGFAYAGEALVGKAVGAGDRVEYHSVIRRLFIWGGIVVATFVLLYAIGGEGVMAMLTCDATVLRSLSQYSHWTLLLPLCGVASFLWDGIYIGATAPRLMLLSMAISMVVFLAGYFFLIPIYGNHGLWVSFLAYLACRGMVQTLMRRKIFF